jgi:hypothetical protein
VLCDKLGTSLYPEQGREHSEWHWSCEGGTTILFLPKSILSSFLRGRTIFLKKAEHTLRIKTTFPSLLFC